MSRSGYGYYCDNWWPHICYRGAVASAIKGKRGQKLLRELAEAMDAMPVKELISEKLVSDEGYCALGVVGKARGLPLTEIDLEDNSAVAKAFDIAEALAREIVFENDEGSLSSRESSSYRWTRMRIWVGVQLAGKSS